MKHQFKTLFGFAAAAAMLLSGCTKDPVTEGNGGNGNEESGTLVYVNAGIALPSSGGSRSATDTPTGDGNNNTNSDSDKNGTQKDYEYGYDYENDVRSVLLVIATTENEYITHTIVSNVSEAPTTGSKFDFIVNGEIQYSDLQAAYDDTKGVFKDVDDSKEPEVYIYAFCNYTDNLLSIFTKLKNGETTDKKAWINEKGTVTESASAAGSQPTISNTIWAKRSFLMTNAESPTAFVFPKKLTGGKDSWDDYTDKSNPYPLGTDGKTMKAIKVERAAARIDFRDASQDNETYGVKGTDNTYKLWMQTEAAKKDEEDKDKETTPATTWNLYNVQLTRMALVNMSKNFYYLRRVSDDGMPTGKNFEVGGPEYFKKTGGTDENPVYKFNYVVDTDAEQKQAVDSKKTGITAANASTYFNFTLFDKNGDYNRSGWYADQLSYVLGGDRDDDTWTGTPYGGKYKIWRYVTENTIPENTKDPNNLNSLQQVQQSTGIVFKAAIVAGADIAKATYPNSTEKLVSEAVQTALKAAADGAEYDKTEQKDSEGKSYKKYPYPILYSFENNLYAGIEDLVKAAVLDGVGGRLYSAVKRILNHWTLDCTKVGGSSDDDAEYEIPTKGEFKYSSAKLPAEKDPSKFYLTPEFCKDNQIFANVTNNEGYTIDFNEDGTRTREAERENGESCIVDLAAKEGITIYKASNETMGNETMGNEKDGSKPNGWGYYCYYFYWNRHNDNGKSGFMGPMEFATVRNNVYKLAVTKISQLGHPRVKTFDPDPVDENDPDEDPMAYIKVQVEVLPWVVRVNDIEF